MKIRKITEENLLHIVKMVKENMDIKNNRDKIYELGFNSLVKVLKKEFPYIVGIETTPIEDVRSRLLISMPVDIIVDLNILYDYTNTKPPSTLNRKYNLDRVNEDSIFLFNYVNHNEDESLTESLGYEINDKIVNIMDSRYKLYPKEVTYKKFQDWDDNDFIKKGKSDLEFYRRWRDNEEPITFSLRRFKPVFDLEKLKAKFPSMFP